MASTWFQHPSFSGWFGVSRADVTPPVGIYSRNWGSAKHDVAEGVHLPFLATALAISHSATAAPLLLISIDLGWFTSRANEWEIRSAVLDALQLDESAVMICATHTHSGAALYLDRIADHLPGTELLRPYFTHLLQAVVDIAHQAVAQREPGILEFSTGNCTLAANRDYFDDIAHQPVCGFNPGVAADQTLLFGRVSTAQGRTLATLVNYACHPTSLGGENKLLSPDFVGPMRELVEAHHAGTPCLFLQGAPGDVAPRDQYAAGPTVAERNGAIIGHAALSISNQMLPPGHALAYAGAEISGTALGLWQQRAGDSSHQLGKEVCRVELELKPGLPATENIERALLTANDRIEIEKLKRQQITRQWVGRGESCSLPIWLWRLGDCIFCALPTEPYSVLQQKIRAAFPRFAIVIVSLCNGTLGYQPPAADYTTDRYQVWQTPFAAGNLEKTIAAIIERISLQETPTAQQPQAINNNSMKIKESV